MGLFILRRELRALRSGVEELRRAIQDHSEAIHTAEERNRNEPSPSNPIQAVVSFDDKTKGDTQRESNRQYGVQNSIRWAAWLAFGAATIYAGIATLQYGEMRTQTKQITRQFQAQQRAWIGYEEVTIMEPNFFVYPDNPIQARTQVNLDVKVPLKNVGISPALNVETSMNATMTEQIGAFQTVEPMMESACSGAEKNAKAVGQVLFPNSPPTSVEWPMAVQTPFIQINQVHRVWINICVMYSSTTDQQIHHTKIWMASWPISGKPTEIRRSASPNIIYYSLPINRWAVVKTEAD